MHQPRDNDQQCLGFNISKPATTQTTGSTHYAQSLLSAGNNTTINVTGDTTLNGGAVSANTINLGVGGNLTVTSTQDSERQTYNSTSSIIGAQAGISLDDGT